MGDEVCKRQQKVEAKYREFLGKYEKASVHLQWRLAHGCFHHGLGHYCVKVKQWCGHGQSTHPCAVEANLSTPESGEKQPLPTTTPPKAAPMATHKKAPTTKSKDGKPPAKSK